MPYPPPPPFDTPRDFDGLEDFVGRFEAQDPTKPQRRLFGPQASANIIGYTQVNVPPLFVPSSVVAVTPDFLRTLALTNILQNQAKDVDAELVTVAFRIAKEVDGLDAVVSRAYASVLFSTGSAQPQQAWLSVKSGTQITIPTTSLTIGMVWFGDIADPPTTAELSAWAAYGGRPTDFAGPTFDTVFTLADGAAVPLQVPPFASSVSLITSDSSYFTGAGIKVEVLESPSGNLYSTQSQPFAAGYPPSTLRDLPLPIGSKRVRVLNGSGAPATITASFRLAF